ncbi:unnamed protein product [Allacma fusca]|uniref:Uncharacterized protein n=1 Tax=Allacma fusca TaxID=39272 RepID=A0A8J2NI68_9HEXA|nr:unnamed protein product [Allacma fusca]
MSCAHFSPGSIKDDSNACPFQDLGGDEGEEKRYYFEKADKTLKTGPKGSFLIRFNAAKSYIWEIVKEGN